MNASPNIKKRSEMNKIVKFAQKAGLLKLPSSYRWNKVSEIDLNQGRIYNFLEQLGYSQSTLDLTGIYEFPTLNSIVHRFKSLAKQRGYRGRVNYKKMGLVVEGEKVRQKRKVDIVRAELVKNVINRYIKNKQFQPVFNLVLKGNTLTKRQAELFFRAVMADNNIKYRMRLVVNGKEQLLPFNDITRKFILHILTNGFIVKKDITFGSDVLDNLNIEDIEELTISPLPRPSRVIKNKDGKFFSYINTTDLNLDRYQIYSQEQSYTLKKREHCLLHALLLAGVSEESVNRVKLSFVVGSNFKKSDIKKVSEIIGRTINLRTIRSRGDIQKTVYNKTEGDQRSKTEGGQSPKSGGDPIDIALY